MSISQCLVFGAVVVASLASLLQRGTVLEENTISEWPWKACDGFFENMSDCKPLMFAVRHGVPNNTRVIAPLHQQRQAIQVVSGCLAVVVVDSIVCADHPDIDGYLKEAHHAALVNYPCYVLKPGDSLVIPVGHAPLWCGILVQGTKFILTARRKGVAIKPEEYTVFMVHAPFDHEADAHHPAETRLAALSAMISALNRVPSSMRERITTWRSEMEKAKPVEEAAPQAAA